MPRPTTAPQPVDRHYIENTEVRPAFMNGLPENPCGVDERRQARLLEELRWHRYREPYGGYEPLWRLITRVGLARLREQQADRVAKTRTELEQVQVRLKAQRAQRSAWSLHRRELEKRFEDLCPLVSTDDLYELAARFRRGATLDEAFAGLTGQPEL